MPLQRTENPMPEDVMGALRERAHHVLRHRVLAALQWHRPA